MTRCGYATGQCKNPRAIKSNGKLHGLCEMHRRNANRNQQRYDRKINSSRSDDESCSRQTPLSENDIDDRFHTLLSVCAVVPSY